MLISKDLIQEYYKLIVVSHRFVSSNKFYSGYQMNTMDLSFIISSLLLGVGLAMDSFSVSMANGLNEPGMKRGKELCIAGTFGFFQALMPMIGWFCVHTIAEKFMAFQPFIPWIALILLLYIGGKMLWEGLHSDGSAEDGKALGGWELFVQGIATAIDALSVGFTIAEYTWLPALVSSLIIGVTTFIISFFGVQIGKKFGMKLSGKASILGGVILIAIGIKVFVSGIG